MSTKIRSFLIASLVVSSLALGGSALARGAHDRGVDARSLPSLTQPQRAKLDAAATAEHQARTALRVALAGQVDRGAIDKRGVAPQVALTKQAAANARKVEEETLSPAQKAELVNAREAKRSAHEGREGDKTDGGGHRGHGRLGKWLALTPEQRTQIQERMKGEPAGDRGIERWVDHLDAMLPVLTPAQRVELSASLRK